MDDITTKARNEIEKSFSPQETLDFLRVKDNFRFVSNGIKEQLIRLGHSGDDDQILRDFCKLMDKEGLNSKEFKCESKWFRDEVLPSKASAIKMCFAFKLSGISKPKTATEFLWNVCRINGFNYRVAEDVIYNYALEHDESYEYAVKLIDRYETETVDVVFEDGDETKGTATLQGIFSNLALMDEAEFFETLCENRKNFIGYNKASHDEFVKLYERLVILKQEDIAGYNVMAHDIKNDIYATSSKKPVEVFSEIIYDNTIIESFGRALIVKKSGNEKTASQAVLADILEKFANEQHISDMKSEASKNRKKATDFGQGYARKTFILCFFAKYVLEWHKALTNQNDRTPVSFYNDFYRRLDTVLRRCSYSSLYPANPFDWLILKCVKTLDDVDPDEDMDAVDLFNEVLQLLACGQEY